MRLSDESRAEREQLLGDIALKRTDAAMARGALDTLAWADRALYHAWRLADSLQTAAAHDRSHAVDSHPIDRLMQRRRPDPSWKSY